MAARKKHSSRGLVGFAVRKRRNRPMGGSRGRRARFEVLEQRCLLASSNTDVRLHEVVAQGGASVMVSYEVADAPSSPFDLGFYRSSDTRFDPSDELLGRVSIRDASDLTQGTHLGTFPIGGANPIRLPGAGAAETDDDYYILAVADPDDSVAESDADPFSEDNTGILQGVYHLPGGDVFIHGTDDPETLSILPGSLRVEVDDAIFTYDGGDVTGLRVRGHGGDDTLNFTYGAGFGLTGPFSGFIDGGPGNDTSTLTGSTGDDVVNVYPHSVSMSGPGYTLEVRGISQSSVSGGGGSADVASFFDSTGDDTFDASPRHGLLSGPGFANTVDDFDFIHAYANASKTDNDTASIEDSNKNDKMRSTSEFAKLYNSQFLVRAKFFNIAHVYARNGGNDVAFMSDSDGNDKFKTLPDQAKMYGAKYFVRAKFFDEVTGYAGKGTDTARMFDSREADRFVGTPTKARLYSAVQSPGFSPFDHTARNFEEVTVYSTAGGNDKARLFDSPGTDALRGRANKTTFVGPGFDFILRRFEEVRGFSQNGGNDVAKLHDTPADNYLEARYTEDNTTWAAMWAAGQNQNLLYEVTGFSLVRAYQTEGTDTADLAGNVDYVDLNGQWQTTGRDQPFKFLGPYPTPLSVSFTDKSGTGRQVYAYSGQVELFAAAQTPVETITSLIASWGGNVLGQLPGTGYYLVGVSTGTESGFIESANGSSAVDFAAPHVVATRGFLTDLNDWVDAEGFLAANVNLGGSVGTDTAMYYDDDFVNATLNCSTNPTHGGAVAFVGSQGLAGGSGRLNTGQVGQRILSGDATAAATHLFLADTRQNDYQRAVINVSSYGTPIDAAGNPLPANVAADNAEVWLRGRAEQLNKLSDEQLEQTLFVTITGNGLGNAGITGIDLAPALNRLHNDFPRLFPADGGPHLIVVGGTLANSTDADTGWNFSTDDDDANGNPLVVYAPSRNVAVSADGCTASGTSFAAPAVSNLLVRSLIRHPELTAGQVSEAFMGAYWRNGYVLPDLDEIDDQIGAPVISIDNTEVTEGDAGETTQAIFLVTLSKPAAGPVTFSYGTSDGTAEDGIDYRGVTTPNVKTIPAGSLGTTVTFEVIGDDEPESDETFLVHLGDLTNARPGDLDGTATISDNDDEFVAPGNVTGTWVGPAFLNNPLGRQDFTFALTLQANPQFTTVVTGTITDGSSVQSVVGTVTQDLRDGKNMVLNVDAGDFFFIYQLVGIATPTSMRGDIKIVDRSGGTTTGEFNFTKVGGLAAAELPQTTFELLDDSTLETLAQGIRRGVSPRHVDLVHSLE